MDLHPIQRGTCVVRNTAAAKGRTRALAPGTSAARHLHYGRIILDPGDAALTVDPGTHETGLVCLRGGATVRVDAKRFALGRYDALYVPRATRFEVARQLLNESDMPAGEIAAVLHYSDASAFSRAFKDWSGTAPREWRQEVRRASAGAATGRGSAATLPRGRRR